MEIADYITAAQDAIEKSPEGIISNSSPIVLWVRSKGKIVQLKPGQVLSVSK